MLEKIKAAIASLLSFVWHYRQDTHTRRMDAMTAKSRFYSSRKSADADLLRVKGQERRELIDRLELFFSGLFSRFAVMREKFSDLRIQRTEAKAKAEVSVQEAKSEKWRKILPLFSLAIKAVRIQFRLMVRAISKFFQRRFDKDHRLATFTALAVMLLLIGFVFAKPRVWQAGLAALAIIGIVYLRKWWKKYKQENGKDADSKNKALRKLCSFRNALLLSFGFMVLTIFGIITGNVWIKAFAPVASVWSLMLPLVNRRTCMAFWTKLVVAVPTLIWLSVWTIIRFR